MQLRGGIGKATPGREIHQRISPPGYSPSEELSSPPEKKPVSDPLTQNVELVK